MVFKDWIILFLTAVVAGQSYWLWVASKHIDECEHALGKVEDDLMKLLREKRWAQLMKRWANGSEKGGAK